MSFGNTEYIYGNWSKYGWGALKVYNSQFQSTDLDFDPEFETKQDVIRFFKNRKILLALPEMTYIKYYRHLYIGVKLWLKGYIR